MTDYGVQPTGYVRKPLSVHLAELEAKLVTEFGPGIIQTSESPLGQLNGMMADLLNEVEEGNLDVYQSYDPDEAEGTRLDILARLRVTKRGERNDVELRQAITNTGEARVDIQDVEHALRGVSGVTFAKMYGAGDVPELERGFVALAIIGGDDAQLAAVIRRYVVPGISTYGNHRVSSLVGDVCRDFSIIRPIEVPVTITLELRARPGSSTCPPPSEGTVKQALAEAWLAARENGMDVSHYSLRTIIEKLYPSIELVSFSGVRDGIETGPNVPVSIGFIEIAALDADEMEVDWA